MKGLTRHFGQVNGQRVRDICQCVSQCQKYSHVACRMSHLISRLTRLPDTLSILADLQSPCVDENATVGETRIRAAILYMISILGRDIEVCQRFSTLYLDPIIFVSSMHDLHEPFRMLTFSGDQAKVVKQPKQKRAVAKYKAQRFPFNCTGCLIRPSLVESQSSVGRIAFRS
jgi:hypothetical protein